MRIQYMSDLHLEFQENSRYLKHNELPVTGDVLVLAGDIFYLRDKVAPLTKFWNWASENYRQVLIVPGNHEYYNYSDVMERGLQWRWMFRENVGYYQNQVVHIDDTDFVLSTLWSRIYPKDLIRASLLKFNGHTEMYERKIIDRRLLADLAKEVGLNARIWRRWAKAANGRLLLMAICWNGWLIFNIGSSGWPQWVTMSIGDSISKYRDLLRKNGEMLKS